MTPKHVRVFSGRRYKLWNVYYGNKQIRSRLKKDVDWAKSHGISYRVTSVVGRELTGQRIKGKALWLSALPRGD